jgi:hypothetical protein
MRKPATGSSTNTASAPAGSTSEVPRSSDTSNHASQTSSAAVAIAETSTARCRRQASSAVAATPAISNASNPTQVTRHWCTWYSAGSRTASSTVHGTRPNAPAPRISTACRR